MPTRNQQEKIDEEDKIHQLEKAYSLAAIRQSNLALEYQIKQKRLREIDHWREEQLKQLEERSRGNAV